MIEGRLSLFLAEVAKLPAFVRRDFLITLSYRTAFLTDIAALIVGACSFYFIGEIVNSSTLPSYEGVQPTYLEFAVVGIAVGAFLAIGLSEFARAMQSEQLTGTLESLLMTPTATATIQLGSVAYDLIYIPLRTLLFIGLVAVLFGLDFDAIGIGWSVLILLAFIPFVWGIGALGAAAVLTFKRGAGIVGFIGTLLVLVSGAFVPLTVMPGWLQAIAEVNPVTLTVNGMREGLIGGAGWSEVGGNIIWLLAISAVTVALGLVAFALARRRELGRGTLGLY